VLEEGHLYRVEDIAEAAGVGLATLYNHFDSKKQLIDAAYERLMSPVTEPIIQADATKAYNPPNRLNELKRYISDVAALACDHRALTVELVKVWADENLGRYRHDVMVPNLFQAMAIIVMGDVMNGPVAEIFCGVSKHFPGAHVSGVDSICRYHLHALLIDACNGGYSGKNVAQFTLDQLIPSLMYKRD
jgi:AcrR family transcriptional regulator